jgi:hypothetical protein
MGKKQSAQSARIAGIRAGIRPGIERVGRSCDGEGPPTRSRRSRHHRRVVSARAATQFCFTVEHLHRDDDVLSPANFIVTFARCDAWARSGDSEISTRCDGGVASDRPECGCECT